MNTDEALPYHPISRFYRERFGEKVYKVSIAVAETCPNREGLRGMKTCNFCDQWGSAAYHDNLKKPVRAQYDQVREVLTKKRGARKFLLYFQAYTTTFSSASRLREQLFTALEYPDLVGLVIGTRPDCLSAGFLETCAELSERTFVSLEMGVQSFNEDVLRWMRRGHTAEQSERALEQIHRACPKVNTSAHLIFGSPGETDQDAKAAADKLNHLGVASVKLHHMHVLKNTPLAEDYARGAFTPLEREEYFARCTLFLQHLRKDIAVHRLAAFSPRFDELVAPAWTAFKMQNYQEMLDYMRARNASQGQYA